MKKVLSFFFVLAYFNFSCGQMQMPQTNIPSAAKQEVLTLQHQGILPASPEPNTDEVQAWQLLIVSYEYNGLIDCKKWAFASYRDESHDVFLEKNNCDCGANPSEYCGFGPLWVHNLPQLANTWTGGIAVVTGTKKWAIWTKANNFYNSLWPVRVWSKLWSENPQATPPWNQAWLKSTYEQALANSLDASWTLESEGTAPEAVVLPEVISSVTLDGGATTTARIPRTVIVQLAYKGQPWAIEPPPNTP